MRILVRMPEVRAAWIAIIAVGIITVIRVWLLSVTPLQLYPDEAQYWWWSQHPALGYFSKPPLIAWCIWVFSHIFGRSIWAIRVASPLFHAGTALLIYAIAERVEGRSLAMWSALAYATIPGVAYSSGLMTTDVPLLFFWALALYALLRALDERGWLWTAICGVAIGVGLLAKYAMLFFLVGLLLAAMMSAKVRSYIFSWRGVSIAAIAVLLISPNIYWNWHHNFLTFGHTAADADWSSATFSVKNVLFFTLGQFGVFGPLLMAGFLTALWKMAASDRRSDTELVLAALALPPLLTMLVQSFISVANANWAAPAYVSATPLAVMALVDVPWAMLGSFIVDTAAMLLLWLVLIWPGTASALGQANAFKREEGWTQLGHDVTAAARARRYDAIAVANRSLMAELTYYAPSRPVPLRAWDGSGIPANCFDLAMPLSRLDAHALLVLLPQEAGAVLPSFESVRLIRHLRIPVGGGITRTVLLYDALGYKGRHFPR
jgi:4-amino-4-deoxy-L-arabinose transferase-like glycosyltransferase